MKNVLVTDFQSKYSSQFYQLNRVWIEESWVLEDSDKKDLLNPEIIIHNGGQIFFAISKDEVTGTVAMIKNSDKIYELAKMTVKSSYRGKGIANLLMDKCIEFAFKKNASEIFLISNDSLTVARNLYEKYGFKEVVLDSQKYKRGNVKMILQITTSILMN